MEFFEKLGKTATETFNSAAEKTNKIATDTKLKIKINDCKIKINELYEEIGKKVYEKYILAGNLEIKDDIQEQLNKIDELAKKVQEYEEKRLELADLKQCINCKNKIDLKAKFCPECGEKQPEEVVHEVEVVDENKENEEEAFEQNEEENVEERKEENND